MKIVKIYPKANYYDGIIIETEDGHNFILSRSLLKGLDNNLANVKSSELDIDDNSCAFTEKELEGIKNKVVETGNFNNFGFIKEDLKAVCNIYFKLRNKRPEN